jgi:hypothetical protein
MLLPTIAARQSSQHTLEASASRSAPRVSPLAISTGSGIVTATVAPATDVALREALAHHLACLAPHARRDRALDARAAELADREDSPLPAAGLIQITQTDGQYILLGADALADLRVADARCGETLIFGVPPLEWLPAGAHFGLGIAMRSGGAIVVVVTP